MCCSKFLFYFSVIAQVSAPYVIDGNIHWSKTLRFRHIGRLLFIMSLNFPKAHHPVWVLLLTSSKWLKIPLRTKAPQSKKSTYCTMYYCTQFARSLDCYLTNSVLKKQSQLFIHITLTIFSMTCLGMLIYLMLDRAILKNIIRDSC